MAMSIQTPAQFDLYIASTTLDVASFRRLERLATLDCLAAVRLYTDHGSKATFQAAARQIGIERKLTVHAPLHPVSMSALIQAALDLGHRAGQSDHPDHAVVVISNQRSAQTLIDWAATFQCDWLFFPALSDSIINSLLHRITSHYDKTAIDLYKDLVKQYRQKAIPVSVWAEAMTARFPELRDPDQRLSRLGRRKFSEFFALLGMPRLDAGGKLPTYPLQLRPRPSLEDLYQVYVGLIQGRRPPFFLHWSNKVLAKWPAMQRKEVRRWLFGQADMKTIAYQAGLVSQDLRLVPRIDIPIKTPEITADAHHAN